MLTAAQITHYRENGYLIVENLLTLEEVEALRERTVAIAEGRIQYPREHIELEPGADTPSLKTVRKLNDCTHDPVFRAHASRQATLDLVEALLGPDLKVYGSQLFMKPPGGVEKPYHQDSPYFPIEPMDLATCWVALDDVTVENGCMWVIPRSHTAGAYAHSEPWDLGGRIDMQIPESKFDRNTEVPLTIPAGGCSFHHSLLLHSSRPNKMPHSRRGLATHYMSAKSRWTDKSKPCPDFLHVRGQEWSGCV